MNHSNNCILSSVCKARDSATCNRQCTHYVSMHGQSGEGGRVGSANIPKDYRQITRFNTTVSDFQTEGYKRIDLYLESLRRAFKAVSERAEGGDNRIKSLYIWSESPGTGKTATASMILNEWMTLSYLASLKNGTRPLDRPCYFLDLNAWQTDYNTMTRQGVPEEIRNKAGKRYYDAMEIAKDVPLLVADDLAVRNVTEGYRGDLHTLINHRVTNQLPVIYTSNLPIESLPDVFGEKRLADRVRDQCLAIQFVGTSKRGIRK